MRLQARASDDLDVGVREALGLPPRGYFEAPPREGHWIDGALSWSDGIFRSELESPSDSYHLERYARHGFRLNAIVRACVNEIATSAAEPRWIVEQRVRSDWVEVRPTGRGVSGPARRLAQLLENPGGEREPCSPYEFFERGLVEYATYGNWFFKKVRYEDGLPGRLQTLPANTISLDGRIGRYDRVERIYVNWDGYNGDQAVGDLVRVEDLVHLKIPDPLDGFWGISPLATVIDEVQTDRQAVAYIKQFFMHAGTPQGLLKVKRKTSPEQRRDLQDQWQAQHGGFFRRWHRLGVLDEDAEYQELGTRPDKLKLDHVFDMTESRVCAVYQVPPIIIAVRIGINRGTYSNYREARTSFWRETLRPLYTKLGQIFTIKVAREFGSDLRVRADLSAVEDLQESREELRVWARQSYLDGIHTQNESRALVGAKPHDGGDHFKTRVSDGLPQELGELPEANPPKPAPARGQPDEGQRARRGGGGPPPPGAADARPSPASLSVIGGT